MKIYRLLANILYALALVGCAAAAPELTPAPGSPLECPSDFCRKAALSAGQSAGCAAETSRSVQDFEKLTLKMNFQEVCARVGPPDWDAGSGLAISVYDLADGSRVLVAFGGPSDMVYIQQVFKDGSARKLAGQ